MFAIVRDPAGSTHLQAAIASLKNVHVIAGDVADYATLEVSFCPCDYACVPYLTTGALQCAAKRVSEISDGKVDYLIHNAAKLDAATVFKGFQD